MKNQEINKQTVQNSIDTYKKVLLTISENYKKEFAVTKSYTKKYNDLVNSILPTGASVRDRGNGFGYVEIQNDAFADKFHIGTVCEIRFKSNYYYEGDITDKDFSYNYSTSGGDFDELGGILRLQLLGNTVHQFKTNIDKFITLVNERNSALKKLRETFEKINEYQSLKELTILVNEYLNSEFNSELEVVNVFIPEDKNIKAKYLMVNSRYFYNSNIESFEIVALRPKTLDINLKLDSTENTITVKINKDQLFKFWKKYLILPETNIETGFDKLDLAGVSSMNKVPLISQM